MVMTRRFTSTSCVPTAPSHLFEDNIAIRTSALVTAAALESGHHQSASLGGRDSGKARNGRGQVAHDMTDGQGTLVQHDLRQVVFGQHGRSDDTCVVQCISQVEIGIGVRRGQRRGAGQVVIVGMVVGAIRTSEGKSDMRTKGRRDGVRRSGKHRRMAGLRGIASSGEAGARLGDIDRSGFASKSHGDAGGSSLRGHFESELWSKVVEVVVVAKTGHFESATEEQKGMAKISRTNASTKERMKGGKIKEARRKRGARKSSENKTHVVLAAQSR